MIDENNVAETSAATAVADMHFDSWDEHGTPIVTEKIEPKKQETAPAAEPAKEAISETEAESETATTQGKKERKPGEKLSRDERIAQLAAQNKKLAEELQAERDRSREAAPKPPTKEPEPVKAEAPKRPNPFKWTGTAEEYEAAMESWEAHQKQVALQEFQRNEAQRALTQRIQAQLDEARAKYPDADEKLKATVESFSKAPLPGVIRGMLDDSECITELYYVMSDESIRNSFIETATKNPGKAIRVLAQMEADIVRSQSASAKSESTAKSDPKPSAEPKPRAPKPPSEVGGRGAAADDELRTAAAAGDFRGFEAEQNRRKFARTN